VLLDSLGIAIRDETQRRRLGPASSESPNVAEQIGSLKGIFPRRCHRSPLARLRRRPLLARGEGGVPSTQQGLARLRAVWTGGAGSVRLRTQEFPGARVSGRPVRKSWGGECRDTIFEV